MIHRETCKGLKWDKAQDEKRLTDIKQVLNCNRLKRYV